MAMTEKKRDIELLALTIFAAIPLYGTQTISAAPLFAFHLTMAAIIARVLTGRSPQLIPSAIMRFLGVAYVFFYVIDAAMISRSAISASTHLVLFIATYQAMEGGTQRNEGQRLLTASLIFIAGVATATHIAILPFVIVFGFLLFRQFIHLSHRDSVEMVTARAIEPPSNRAAAFYVCGSTMIGVLLFPVLPRLRNPLVRGMVGNVGSSATGLSDSINLNEQSSVVPD